MPHLRYLSYVLRHKWYVLLAGLRVGAPIWRLLVHDWTKFTRAEWGPYVRHFYDRERSDPRQFQRALLHHVHCNEHHWQHWVLVRHDGKMHAQPMPDSLVLEMIADWLGASRAKTGSWDMSAWWSENEATILLHRETRERVNWLLEMHA